MMVWASVAASSTPESTPVRQTIKPHFLVPKNTAPTKTHLRHASDRLVPITQALATATTSYDPLADVPSAAVSLAHHHKSTQKAQLTAAQANVPPPSRRSGNHPGEHARDQELDSKYLGGITLTQFLFGGVTQLGDPGGTKTVDGSVFSCNLVWMMSGQLDWSPANRTTSCCIEDSDCNLQVGSSCRQVEAYSS
jgi:hypothetical protein